MADGVGAGRGELVPDGAGIGVGVGVGVGVGAALSEGVGDDVGAGVAPGVGSGAGRPLCGRAAPIMAVPASVAPAVLLVDAAVVRPGPGPVPLYTVIGTM